VGGRRHWPPSSCSHLNGFPYRAAN
jgi:hypothetical protein